jgi:serine/threonine protein kinase
MTRDFGEYRLRRLMGEGGMAQVWAATRQTLGGPMSCAVKIIRPRYADDPSYREMFQREARLSLALSGHGNVVSVFDVGEHEGRSYLAMELVEGVTLTELARRVGKPWPVPQAVYVAAGVLRALCHIHGYALDGRPQGIVHRDVTPHNVMISARGEVKLTDFGIAQRADAEPCLGGALGKLAYVPREQVEGDPDQRADLYAAGALLYELLDGRRFRWHCADEDAFFLEIYRDRVPTLARKDVPPAVIAVLRGLLQPDRARRIPNAAEALRQLEAWPGFRWALTELEAIYAAVIRPPPGADTSPGDSRRPSGEPGGVDASASSPGGSRRRSNGEAGRADPSSASSSGPRRRPSGDVPRGRRPWDDSSPSAANDSGRAHWAPTLPHLESVGAKSEGEPASASGATPIEPDVAAPARRRKTVSAPGWAEDPPSSVVTDELPVAEELDTRLLPAAERNPELAAEPMERLVTRRHPSAPNERDVPSARASAEIAVTMPQPSRHAPWAEGTDPIARRLVQPEPGAPLKRRRRSTSGGLEDHTGSVAPRLRESAAIHAAASDGHVAASGSKPGVVAGEIVTPDEGPMPVSGPVWRMGSRR